MLESQSGIELALGRAMMMRFQKHFSHVRLSEIIFAQISLNHAKWKVVEKKRPSLK